MRRKLALCLALGACQSGGGDAHPPARVPPLQVAPTGEPRPPTVRAQQGPVRSATLRHRLAHPQWIGGLAWSPDAARLATGDDDGRVRIWDARTGQLARDLGKHDRRISALAYDAAGDLLAVAGLTDLRIWSATTGARLHNLPGHEDIVADLTFVGDELHVVDLRDSLRRWHTRTGRELARLEVPTIHALSLALTPRGDALAIGGHGDLVLLNLPGKQRRFGIDAMPRCSDAPDDLLCAAWKERQIEEFADEGSPPGTHKETSPRWYVEDLAFAADASLLLIGRADGVAVLLDAATGRPLARFSLGDDEHAWVALTPDGATAALANRDGRIALWNVATRARLDVVHEPGQIVGRLAFAPDASALAAAGPGPAATIWDLTR